MGYITYKQADSRWGSKNYNGSSTMATAGCGPTSVAMLAYAVDGKTTPIQTMKYMQTHGDKKHKTFALYGHGTAWNGIPACMKAFGLQDVKEVNVNTSMANVWKYLAKGYCADFLFDKGTKGGITWTTSGHYVAVTNYRVKNGKHYVYTRDSGSRNHTGWYCYETQMKGLIPKVWVGLVPGKEVITTPKPTINKPTGKYKGIIAEPVIKKNSSGNQVKNLQKFLNWYGNFNLKVDGNCAAKTVSAIKLFQKTEGLKEDGVYGKKSYEKARKYEKTSTSREVLKVIDVSYWQHTIDWKKVAGDKVDGAILRTSYTSQSKFSMSKDSKFVDNIKGAIKNNIAVGAYHYSQAISVSEAKKEAEYTCKILKSHKNDINMPVVCDWEFGGRLNSNKAKSLGKKKCTEIISAFCEVIKKNGYIPMVYANFSTFDHYLNVNTFKKAGYLIWLAQYSDSASMDYDMWQYSSSANVKGISGRVDINKTSKNIIKK